MGLDLVATAHEHRKLVLPTQTGLGAAAEELFNEFDLRSRAQAGRRWMQDLWFLIYNLIDTSQAGAPPSRPRYNTSQPMAIVDTGRRVLARNPLRYRLIAPQQERLQLDGYQKLENVLHGVMYDIDRQLIARGEQRSRMQVAFHALVRGQWAYKFHLTKESGSVTGSPIHYRQLDPRLCLPSFDLHSNESTIYHDIVTLSQLLYTFPDKVKPIVDQIEDHQHIFGNAGPGRTRDYMYTPLVLIEWSSTEEHAVLVDLAGLPDTESQALKFTHATNDGRRYLWLSEPQKHGFERSLIQVGNVNGIPATIASTEAAVQFAQHSVLNRLPVHRNASNTVSEEAVSSTLWVPPSAGVSNQSLGGTIIDPGLAMTGRSILAPVAHLFPEYNEMMALLKQAVIQEVRGTWVFKSRDGKMVSLSLGTGDINPMTLQETLEKVNANIEPPDSIAIMQLIQQDISQGSLDLRFLLANDFEGSGFARQRMEAASMTNLVDYQQGMEDWAVSVAESFIVQFRAGHGKLGSWKLSGRQPSDMTKFFVVDIDDEVKKILVDGPEPPVIEAKAKVALPIDMAARINMAKTAIDPNNPIMSLGMALDIIMEFDDTDAVYDEILRDIGERNPTIQLVQIAQKFHEAGAPELAEMIMQDDFRTGFANASQQAATSTPGGAAKGTSPGTAPPEVTGAAKPQLTAPAG